MAKKQEAPKTAAEIKTALTEARRRRREQAEIFVQQAAVKTARGQELTDADLLQLSQLADDIGGDAFERAVNALSRVPRLEARVAGADLESGARAIRVAEAELTQMVCGHRAKEKEMGDALDQRRAAQWSDEAAVNQLAALQERYPHAFT